MPHIPLPKFTFLCGPPGSGQTELIKALVEQDDSLLRMDFTSCIHDLVANLFPDSFPFTMDPLGEHADKSIMGYDMAQVPDDEFLPISTVTVEQAFYGFSDALRDLFGPRALGLMSLRAYRHSGSSHIFERIIFSDALNPEDIEVFIDVFGKENCLAIHLG
jgi:hypothetical protein